MNSDLKILDPIWTTAYVQRGFGYMVWDVLFAVDEKFEVKPQMVDKYDVSADKLTWTFTLRDGLVWSDGKPVSLRRLHRLDQALGRPGFDGSEADGRGRRLRGGRRQDLQDEDEGALWPGARVARQAVGERALHDAEEDGRYRPDAADQGRGRDRLGAVRLRGQSNGNPARRSSSSRTRPTSRAPSRPRAWPAARLPRSTGSSGSGFPIRRPRHRRCSTARST